jgi:Protein of unknown function (DUF2975)
MKLCPVSYRLSMRVISYFDIPETTMTRTSARALTVARPVIQGLILLNAIYALVIAGLLGYSFFIAGWPQRPLGLDLVKAHPLVGHGLRAIVVVGVIGAAIVHTVLRRLLAIVDTVRVGDPFILENARRLDAIAWSVVALEALRLVVAAIAAAVWEPGRVDAFSFAPWLAVLLLFVLAGVFAHGARIREDLEGTV